MEFEDSIIVDFGTLYSKVGLNSQEEPTVFKTVIDGRYPLTKGRSTKVDDYDFLFKKIFDDLKVEAEDYAVLLAKPVFFPKVTMEEITKLLFEKYKVQAVNFTGVGVLNCHSLGETTCLSVELGEGLTQLSPIFRGYMISHTEGNMNFGGLGVTDELIQSIRERKMEISNSFNDREYMRKVKEENAFVASNFEEELKKFKEKKHCEQEITLPDGKKINLGVELFRAPELYFSTSHLDVPNIVQAIETSIKKSYMDVRKDLWSKIYISGGGSEMEGLRTRLWDELKKVAPQQNMVRVREHQEEYSVFTGGKMLSKREDFDDMYFAKEDFEEEGVKGIHKKRTADGEEDSSSSSDSSSDDDTDTDEE